MQLSHPFIPLLHELGNMSRETVLRQLHHETAEDRSRTTGHAGSDVIYAIDREVEEQLVRMLEQVADDFGGIVLVAEGIGEDEITSYPANRDRSACRWRLLVDPIDGTRGIMMDKRSAWFLAGVAPNRGDDTRLSHVECACMTELPTSRAAVADSFVAVRGKGVQAIRHDLIRGGEGVPIGITPYTGSSIRGGFAQVCRFFTPGKLEAAQLEEALFDSLFPDAGEGEILGFEDQYISTGGQLVELLTGRDRFTADLRATLYMSILFKDRRIGHVCHPYDLAGMLVAEEAGVVLTDASGAPLDAPFDTRAAVDWVGYANTKIRREVEQTLLSLLETHHWSQTQD